MLTLNFVAYFVVRLAGKAFWFYFFCFSSLGSWGKR